MSTCLEIQSNIDSIENDQTIYDESSLDTRLDVIEFIEFPIIDQIEQMLEKNSGERSDLILLKNRAEKVKRNLEAIDEHLFKKLRLKFVTDTPTRNYFKSLVNSYFNFNFLPNDTHQDPGYDNLDIFINRLFPDQKLPWQTKDLEPEMVYYQKTPARIIFELAAKFHFTQEDIFVDVGSGLGQAAILINLITGVRVIGIEFEPAFYKYAKDCAGALQLSNVSFINVDARKADYSEGTVFFMSTPFNGTMMQEVLAQLRKQSLQRKITIIAYGRCIDQLTSQLWLHGRVQNENVYQTTVFTSL